MRRLIFTEVAENDLEAIGDHMALDILYARQPSSASCAQVAQLSLRCPNDTLCSADIAYREFAAAFTAII